MVYNDEKKEKVEQGMKNSRYTETDYTFKYKVSKFFQVKLKFQIDCTKKKKESSH